MAVPFPVQEGSTSLGAASVDWSVEDAVFTYSGTAKVVYGVQLNEEKNHLF
jgi:hypothetical protein